MSESLRDAPHSKPFVDGIATKGNDIDDFCIALDELYMWAEKYHVYLNAAKCVIGARQLVHIGRLVSGEGIAPDPSRFRAILDMRPPQSRGELQSFLGLAQYYAQFIRGVSTIAAPLWPLLKRNSVFVWEQEQQRAFEAMKQAIVHAPILAQYTPGAPVVLLPDGCQTGIGGALCQRVEPHALNVLFFYSRKLTDAETRYSTIEIEALAIVEGLTRGRRYLMGPILVLPDHSNLQFMANSSNARVQRWRVLLSDLDYTVEYAPGRLNFIADCLSRLIPDTSAAGVHPHKAVYALRTVKDVRQPDDTGNAEDPTAELMAKDLRTVIAELDGVVEDDHIILRRPPPREAIHRIWVLAHCDPLCGHFGISRTTAAVKSVVRWSGMDAALAELNRACPACQKLKTRPPHPAEPLATRASRPGESLFIDYIGKLRPSNGFRYILTIIDRFSCYVALVPTRDQTATTTANALVQEWFSRFGPPDRLTSDGGPAFASERMRRLCEQLEIKSHISVPHHPEGHGVVERANQVASSVIRSQYYRRSDWFELVRPAAFAMNTAYSRAIGTTPFHVMHGFPPRLPLHHALGVPNAEPSDDPVDFADKLVVRAQEIRAAVTAAHAKLELETLDRYRSTCRKPPRRYQPGDYVLVRRGRPEKLLPEWAGPELVVKEDDTIPDHRVYVVRSLLSGEESRAHVDIMAPFRVGALTQDQLRFHATGHDEYLIDSVLAHEVRDKELWFQDVWTGYPLAADDPESWVHHADCRFAPAVRDYIAAHNLG